MAVVLFYPSKVFAPSPAAPALNWWLAWSHNKKNSHNSVCESVCVLQEKKNKQNKRFSVHFVKLAECVCAFSTDCVCLQVCVQAALVGICASSRGFWYTPDWAGLLVLPRGCSSLTGGTYNTHTCTCTHTICKSVRSQSREIYTPLKCKLTTSKARVTKSRASCLSVIFLFGILSLV